LEFLRGWVGRLFFASFFMVKNKSLRRKQRNFTAGILGFLQIKFFGHFWVPKNRVDGVTGTTPIFLFGPVRVIPRGDGSNAPRHHQINCLHADVCLKVVKINYRLLQALAGVVAIVNKI
jgi:hypothetical protein